MELTSASQVPDESSAAHWLALFPDLAWVKDARGRYRFCNPAFEHFFGLTDVDVIGRTDFDVLPRDIATAFRDQERRVSTTLREQWHLQRVTAESEQGGARLLEIRRVPLIDGAGAMSGILASARPVHDRVPVVDGFGDTETRFHQLFEQIQAISVQGYDRNRRVIYWNPASSVLYGYGAEEALGRQLEDLIIPDFMREDVVAGVNAWVAGGPAVPAGELTLKRADGTPVHVFSSHVVLRGTDGEPQMYCVDVDLSERKAAEERILKLSLAVEQSPEAIIITDLDGRIEYVNESCVRNSGYSRDEIIGRSQSLFESGLTPPETHADLWATLRAGREWRGELINRRRDGSLFTEMALIMPIRQPDGRISHYVAIKEDITEKKRIQEELERHRLRLEELVAERTAQLYEARVQAEAANQAKSAFLANMSHEIRTPLNAILGLTYLVSRDQSASPQAREFLSKIGHSAGHLLSIINDILDLSKIESGKFSLHPQNFSSDELFLQLESLIQAQLQAKGLRFVRRTETLPSVLHGDQARLRQALLNYLSNAVKFTSQGTVTLEARLVEESDTDLLVHFDVIDTGIGIAEEDVARLFQPFSQVDNSMARQFSGTGLGLVITQHLARLMGGAVGAESQAGSGSRFWMTARLGRATQAGLGDTAPPTDQPEAEAERLLADRFAGARILVVEDNEINQDVIRNLLEIVGLCVDLASSGGAAIEMACRDRYDLILMDIQMPEMDGVRATQLLRGRADWRPCPVLAMTANVFEEERRRYLSEGLDDHILKPVDPPHLYAVLLQWLSANHARALAVGTDSVPGGARAAAVPDSSALLERLGGLPGVDVELGLRVLVGEERLYARLLRKYALTHAEDVGRLRESIAIGDSSGAQHLAHTLKGTSGNLGLVRIASLMAELLDGLRAGRSAAELEAPLAAAEIAQRELIERILTDA